MRVCSACGREYGDETNFCLEDGTRLRSDEPPTVAFPTKTFPDPATGENTVPATLGAMPDTLPGAHPTTPEPRRNFSLPILLLAVGGSLIVGGILAAVGLRQYLFAGSRTESTNVSSVNGRTPEASPATSQPNALETPFTEARPSPGATPSKSATPTPRPTATPRSTPPGNEENETAAVPLKNDPKPKTVSGGNVSGKAIYLPRPPYPAVARAAGVSGAVNVQVLIGEGGQVISASAVSGPELLREAAVTAARQARFQPTLLSGQAVKVTGFITYNFVPQ